MTNTNTHTLSDNCTGPNSACRKAAKAGRKFHVIPWMPGTGVSLVMPTYHYATEAEGIAAVELATRTAPTVTCDDELYAYRRMNVAHYLPAGWVDPSRR